MCQSPALEVPLQVPLQVYAAILLGFLLEKDSTLRQEAADLLQDPQLLSVTSAITRGLHFYVNAGAISQTNAESLRALIASLGMT